MDNQQILESMDGKLSGVNYDGIFIPNSYESEYLKYSDYILTIGDKQIKIEGFKYDNNCVKFLFNNFKLIINGEKGKIRINGVYFYFNFKNKGSNIVFDFLPVNSLTANFQTYENQIYININNDKIYISPRDGESRYINKNQLLQFLSQPDNFLLPKDKKERYRKLLLNFDWNILNTLNVEEFDLVFDNLLIPELKLLNRAGKVINLVYIAHQFGLNKSGLNVVECFTEMITKEVKQIFCKRKTDDETVEEVLPKKKRSTIKDILSEIEWQKVSFEDARKIGGIYSIKEISDFLIKCKVEYIPGTKKKFLVYLLKYLGQKYCGITLEPENHYYNSNEKELFESLKEKYLNKPPFIKI